MTQPSGTGRNPQNGRPSWDPRKVLLCVLEGNRETMARALADNGYQVFVARDTSQAVDRMRENQLEVVGLDSRFDQVEQGFVFVDLAKLHPEVGPTAPLVLRSGFPLTTYDGCSCGFSQ